MRLHQTSLIILVALKILTPSSHAFTLSPSTSFITQTTQHKRLFSSSPIINTSPSTDLATATDDAEDDGDSPEDAVITIKPLAMNRLKELKDKQPDPSAPLILRMGVRNGGCSGLSYVMDFSTEDAIEEEDAVDEYAQGGIKCVVDAKSMLYLYGLELDYSEELIGGGFKFFNPNAEESCGCGSSFGV
mmetsp:Transcript_25044/g.36792  ORF Transcript_25044/g.36792 Transcript_25044/m.36792 type:complete len:188 (+) Transcript_25044:111-674(+)|eukprot:CAMPEP_0195525520 /NCGR_PEP_ID=MMETSP0794_2-20130614/25997_1 /TAXON_ID=515487 /ORGANISM="Stephanopyxis turris, Strain CCMP 815" /LENGTH=187 /DNA_ID=CAMNT_0040655999 /DNA_START=107 /DNA_END=670 /DNA_ORIENTATION=+